MFDIPVLAHLIQYYLHTIAHPIYSHHRAFKLKIISSMFPTFYLLGYCLLYDHRQLHGIVCSCILFIPTCREQHARSCDLQIPLQTPFFLNNCWGGGGGGVLLAHLLWSAGGSHEAFRGMGRLFWGWYGFKSLLPSVRSFAHTPQKVWRPGEQRDTDG